MAKVYIALQTPSVILKITSQKDCEGKSETLRAEFRRYDGDASARKFASFQKLFEPVSTEGLSQQEADTVAKDALNQIRHALKQEIIALYDIPLFIEDEKGKLNKLVVKSTKNAEKNDELWGEPENCLDFLLDIILESTPWSSPITTALYSALGNVQLGVNAETKN